MKLSKARICIYRILGIVAAILLMFCLMGSCSQPAFASETIGGGSVTNEDSLWNSISHDGTVVDEGNVGDDSAPTVKLDGATNNIQNKIWTILTYCCLVGFLISLLATIFIINQQKKFPVWVVAVMVGFLILVDVFCIIAPKLT